MNPCEEKIIEAAQSVKGRIVCTGSWGAYPSWLAGRLSETLDRPILIVHPHIEDSDCAADEIHSFISKQPMFLPAWEGEQDLSDSVGETAAERLKAAAKIPELSAGDVMCASVQALSQPLPDPEGLEADALSISCGKNLEPELAASWLADQGYEPCEAVDAPGEFAKRGGILDIYPPAAGITDDQGQEEKTRPIRIEFFGDEVETIRYINLDNQTSEGEIQKAEIYSRIQPMPEGGLSVFELLRKDAVIIFAEPSEASEVLQAYLSRVSGSEKYFTFSQIYKAASELCLIEVSRFGSAGGEENHIQLCVESIDKYKAEAGSVLEKSQEALGRLCEQAETGEEVLLFCESAGQIKRTKQLILSQRSSVPENLHIKIGYVREGFSSRQEGLTVIGHHEIFAREFVRRRAARIRRSAAVHSLSDLASGDYVVHLTNGIAIYRGTKIIEQNQCPREHMILEFADEAKIFVPVENISLVHKYIGSGGMKPSLSKLGGKRWFNQKKKAYDAVMDMASEMLELQAKRNEAGGFAFSQDCDWQREFEDAFPYQETPDQIKAIEEIKADMQSPKPMERLLCGDVGYGKTEIAMRAAFKAVLSGKQTALLAPTTILTIQHANTFRNRFAGYPVRIEVLNRFISAGRAKEIIEQSRAGRIDILIGTHRLLSKDIAFADLGLLIIDEEQRFGVEHKEKLKKLKVNVDILSLSATPIPRTLHMSLMGIRDISTLSTPPLDRRSVATSIHRYDNSLIKQIISRELAREGQVFFLHNIVKTIDKTANLLRELFPDSNIAVAHGQMNKKRLEKSMLDFAMKKIDILVCSTIIESGIDIPNANTIVINNADRFGLAQLHQLRGRVGRFKRKARAELLIPPDRPITPVAARRLKAIEEYSELGAGFQIALRDLEIRGAGNILGAEQSGHIDTVGYELYCQMLKNAVKQLKGDHTIPKPETSLNLGFSAYIPKNYIPSDKQRLGAYRKAAEAETLEDLLLLEKELKDLFGKLPEQAVWLIDLAKIKLRASENLIARIKAQGQDLVFTFSPQADDSKAADIFNRTSRRVTAVDKKTVHVRLSKHHFEPPTILAFLRKLFSC
ncbi:transcription-repair coupling factor [Sedimentisphaera salicampi]|uniref:transcription-repair coupling factor n=1 Tax=Sedimentisphaera salicampi TaxID=1941349 RepID=UPI000B9C19C0|nr:transcription-repair coupling factor [Sedimentisphaera salicampi]OXU14246.1 Transcription-repair-coupling factor [Sedimentisphaera salicampi]